MMLNRRKHSLTVVPDDAVEAALAGFEAELAQTSPIVPVPPQTRPIDIERAIVADDIAALETRLAASRAEIARLTELAEQDAAILAGKRGYLASLNTYETAGLPAMAAE